MSANKVTIVVTSEVTQLSVFRGTHSNSSKQEQSNYLFGCFWYKAHKQRQKRESKRTRLKGKGKR